MYVNRFSFLSSLVRVYLLGYLAYMVADEEKEKNAKFTLETSACKTITLTETTVIQYGKEISRQETKDDAPFKITLAVFNHGSGHLMFKQNTNEFAPWPESGGYRNALDKNILMGAKEAYHDEPVTFSRAQILDRIIDVTEVDSISAVLSLYVLCALWLGFPTDCDQVTICYS